MSRFKRYRGQQDCVVIWTRLEKRQRGRDQVLYYSLLRFAAMSVAMKSFVTFEYLWMPFICSEHCPFCCRAMQKIHTRCVNILGRSSTSWQLANCVNVGHAPAVYWFPQAWQSNLYIMLWTPNLCHAPSQFTTSYLLLTLAQHFQFGSSTFSLALLQVQDVHMGPIYQLRLCLGPQKTLHHGPPFISYRCILRPVAGPHAGASQRDLGCCQGTG